MGSRTNPNPIVRKKELEKFASNVAEDLNQTAARSFSVAMCFDALLTVLDRRRRSGTPSIADEVKEILKNPPWKKPEETKPEEKPEDANKTSNE